MALSAGSKAVGSDFQNLESKQHAPLDSGTTASTSFTTTRAAATSPVGVSFTAPPSGKVGVSWKCGIINSGSGGTNWGAMGFQVRSGSTLGAGTAYQSASLNLAIQHLGQSAGGAEQKAGMTELVEGLTPGANYNVTVMFAVGAGTGTFSSVSCSIDPRIA